MNTVNGCFSQHSMSPQLNQEPEGIAIQVHAQPSTFMLYGTCRATVATAASMPDSVLHNIAIACFTIPELHPTVFPVIQDQVVFPDDLYSDGTYITAFFNIDLSERNIFPSQGQTLILASFHTFLSQTILI